MANWFSILSISNILIFFLGFIVGRFWRLGKKMIKKIQEENKQ